MQTATATNPGKTTRIKLPPLHAAQTTIKRGMGRYNVVNCGRRFGKDYLAQDRAVHFSLYKRMPVAWLAPSYRMLTDNFRMLSNTLAPVITRKLNNERIDLLGGGYIDFWSLEQPDRVRGRKYAHVIINEAAMVEGLEDAFNMVIAPTLVDLRGSCDFYSTPKGLNGFYNFYSRAVDIQHWERFHYTTFDNPTIPRDEIEAMVSMLPERVVRQEIMAEFVEDGAYFQGVREAAIIEHPDDPDNHADHYLVAGVDWAKQEDYTVITVSCRECNRAVDWDRFNKIDFTYQRLKLQTLVDKWKCAVLPERNSIGEPNIEIIRATMRVLNGPDDKPGFLTTATTKPTLIEGLAAGIGVHGYKIPTDYKDEMTAYQVEIMDSGRSKFGAPTGQHDDRVISAALSWWAMGRYQAPAGAIEEIDLSNYKTTRRR